MKNVKECRDVIVKKVLKQGWDTLTTHYTHVGPMTPYIVVINYMTCIACLCKKQPDLFSTSAAVLSTLHTVSDNDVGCHRSNMCVMCSKSVPTLFQYFFYDHILTFLYIFHEMFFITCLYAFFLLLYTNIS